MAQMRNLLKRLRRLWELSGVDSNGASVTSQPADRFFTGKKRKKRDQKLATILQDDPLEDEFPNDEENDTPSK